jgi:hypothetical protein
MLWRRLGRFVVTVHSGQEPSDEEWGRYLAQACDHLPLEEQRILVISGGGAPNAAQRRELVQLLGGARTPTAILTASWVMRGAGTAVSWFNPSLRIFGPNVLDQAMDYLQLTPNERKLGLQLIQEFQRQLRVQVVRAFALSAELGG